MSEQRISAAIGLACAIFLGQAVALQAAGTVSISTVAPTTNLIEFFDSTQTTTSTNWAVRRIEDIVGSTGSQCVGQTFQHETAFQIKALTVQVGSTGRDFTVGPAGTQILQIGFGEDTNADGTPDTLFGAVETFDMRPFNVAALDFITFTFPSALPQMQAGKTYGFYIWFTNIDANHILLLRRSNIVSQTNYPKGGYILDTTLVFPPLGTAPGGGTGLNHDGYFFLQSEPSGVGDWKAF